MATPKAKASSSKKVEKEVPVELGFLEEENNKWKLRSAFFPSKFGGLPAWLDLKSVPSASDLKCSSCDGQTKFLLQIYAPLDSAESFHRTIFVFICSNQKCCVEKKSNKNLIALRCQLPKENEFYSSEPPNEDDPKVAELSPLKFGVTQCQVCGAKSTQHCSGCQIVAYCGRNHQLFHWEKGHKSDCKKPDLLSKEPKDTFGYEEYAVVIDTEVIPKQSNKKRTEKEKLEDYQKLMTEGQAGSLANDDSVSTKEMLEAASYKSDKAFNKFKKRIAYHQDQILRYDRKGEPLWVAAEKKIEKSEIPNCPYCKGPRVFEFQIMPQLLNYVGNDSVVGDLDWGTLAVYTCENNCTAGPAYKSEFVWQQDFKADDKDYDD